MIPYSLHVAIIVAICLVFYKLLLYKETYYRLNRIILLSCLVLAFVLPLIPVPQQYSLRHEAQVVNEAPSSILQQEPAQTLSVQPKPLKAAVKSPVEQTKVVEVLEVPLTERVMVWIWWIYWCGVAILAINLIIQLIVLFFQAYGKPVIRDGIYRIIELDNDKAPCSFGNLIFINPSKYDWDTYNQILVHEKVHIQQGHSFDLILAELVLVVQWFNPFAWLYRKELESNLEFLADDSVLQNHQIEREGYQLSLLKVAVPNQAMNITINYNQSLIKKRIVMMNAKKSNVHTMWKYVILLPLMAILLCGLNEPVANSHANVALTNDRLSEHKYAKLVPAAKDGSWSAKIKNKKVQVKFESDYDEGINYRWSDLSTFNLNEFSSIPKTKTSTFTIKREAGTVTFTGKFNEDQGTGRFSFVADKEYKDYLFTKGIAVMKDEEYISFFMLDIKKQYVQLLTNSGFKKLTKDQLISSAALKIDANYIYYWRKNGFANLSLTDVLSLRKLRIDSNDLNDIRKEGNVNFSLKDLINFKNQKLARNYRSTLGKTASEEAPFSNTTKTQIITGARSTFSKSIIEPQVNRMDTISIEKTEFARLSPNNLNILKQKGINPELIKRYLDAGMKDLSYNTLVSLADLKITPELIQAYKNVGVEYSTTGRIYNLQQSGITPELIKDYIDIGMKDLSLDKITSLKNRGVTAAYIKSFQEVGIKNVPIDAYIELKDKGIEIEYVKSFKNIGYTNIPFDLFSCLKRSGVTAEFVKGFLDLGFKNVPPTLFCTLKSQKITPQYVLDMRKIGFNSNDLSKYLQVPLDKKG